MRHFTLCVLLILSICLGLTAVCTADTAGGLAVVINVDAAPGASLPSGSDAAAIASAYRAEGFKVAVTPDGSCMAVTKPQPLSGGGPVSDSALRSIAAARLAGSVGSEYDSHIYFTATPDDLPAQQRAEALEIARSAGFLNGRMEPRDLGTALHLSVKPGWTVHVTVPLKDEVFCQKLCRPADPPTPEAIAAKPLTGSALWYAWPYSQSSIAGAKVSVPAGEYSPAELGDMIAKAAGVTINTKSDTPCRLRVVANSIPALQLLWAIETATQLQVTIDQTSQPAVVTISDVTRMEPSDHNVTQSIPGIGHYPALSPLVAAKMSASCRGVCDPAGEVSMVWRFADLPAVYREAIQRSWDESRPSFVGYTGPLDAEHAIVVWTGVVTVGVEMNSPNGGGCGTEVYLLAL